MGLFTDCRPACCVVLCYININAVSCSFHLEFCVGNNPVTQRTFPLSNSTRRQSTTRINTVSSERTETCPCWLEWLRKEYSCFPPGEILRCSGRRSGKLAAVRRPVLKIISCFWSQFCYYPDLKYDRTDSRKAFWFVCNASKSESITSQKTVTDSLKQVSEGRKSKDSGVVEGLNVITVLNVIKS